MRITDSLIGGLAGGVWVSDIKGKEGDPSLRPGEEKSVRIQKGLTKEKDLNSRGKRKNFHPGVKR